MIYPVDSVIQPSNNWALVNSVIHLSNNPDLEYIAITVRAWASSQVGNAYKERKTSRNDSHLKVLPLGEHPLACRWEYARTSWTLSEPSTVKKKTLNKKGGEF